MNTEEAWRTWWDAEGKHMERLPHHDAVDHIASVTRIAWLNGAFGAADEIDRLRKERDEARREVCVAREAMIRLMIHGDVAVPQEAMHQAAKARGWDCFKENTDER